MNKDEYLKALTKNLRRLPAAELDKAIQYYTEYFDEAGIDEEERVIEELGDPKTVASQIITQTAMKRMESDKAAGRFTSIWLIILAIFAAPVGFPLAFAFVVVILALCFSLFVLVASLIFSTVVCFIAGIFSLIASMIFFFQHIPSSIMIAGSGLMCIGAGILLGIASSYLCKWAVRCVIQLSKRVIKRRK